MPFEGVTIGSARLIRGDCRDVLAALPPESVHCCVTSPPYFGLRDYGVPGQIGLEQTPAAYIQNLVEIMRGVRRVLRSDGTLWLNIGDSYGTGKQGNSCYGDPSSTLKNARSGMGNKTGEKMVSRQRKPPPSIKPKDLIGIPWMLAFALRDDGWYLRRDIIWHKPNPMPESVTDRPTSAHEYLFLLTKSARYFYDSDAIKEPATSGRGSSNKAPHKYAFMGGTKSGLAAIGPASSRTKRSVWTIATAPFRGAHFATFPPALVEPCILAGTSERGVCPKCGAPWVRDVKQVKEQSDRLARGKALASPRHDGNAWNENNGRGFMPISSETIGWRPTCSCKAKGVARPTVIDPFGGAATTALTASKLGRRSISIELSAAYHDIACERIAAIQKAEAA